MLACGGKELAEGLPDASGVELTRNPLGLASALRKIGAAHEPTRVINQGTAHMCITDPRGMRLNNEEGGMSNLMGTHPPIGKRIAILESMAGMTGSGPPVLG